MLVLKEVKNADSKASQIDQEDDNLTTLARIGSVSMSFNQLNNI